MSEKPGARPPKLLQAHPHRLWSIFSVLTLFVFSGIFVQLLPASAPALIAEWKLDDTAFAAPIAAGLLGAGAGTVLGGILADISGRRILIGASTLALTFFLGISVFATAPLFLVFTMFFSGLAMGCLYSPGMALVTELSPPERRAFAISLTVFSLPIGLTLCSLTAAAILPLFGWKTLFLMAAAFGVPAFFLFAWFTPESPSYLARKAERKGELEHVLSRLSLDPPESPTADEDLRSGKGPSLVAQFSALVKTAPGTIVGLFLLFLFANLFGSAVLSWVPVAFTNLGFSLAFSSGALTGWTIASMIGIPVAGWLIGKIGWYIVAPIGALLTGIALLLLGLFAGAQTNPTALFAMLVMGGIGTAGVVTALYTLAVEIFPATMRASGLGISDAIGRIGGLSGAFFGVHVLAFGGVSGFFLTLSGVMATIIVILLFLRRSEVADAK